MGIKKQKQPSTLKGELKIRFLDGPMPSIYRNSGSQSSFSGLMGALQSVNTNSPEAKLNKTSISDNNGGRIELNQENIIKK
ncbi:MAG: hypothetical protein M1142_04325 [Patescibacteria group bacterium]|nr:hypothetical protein [Patescibacteria group bacterium]